MAMTKERLAEWLSDIRKGDLYCPFEQCTWTFFTAFELADHLLDDCEFGRYKGNVPCTHCNEALKAEELKHHWRTYHKDEVSVLAHLDRGTQSCCPNYLCARIFQGTFDGCKEYLKHSITCHPLYICVKCKGEFKTKLILTQHSPICKGEVKREVLKSVSKNETRIDRDVKQRPKLTDEEENRHIQEWKKAIKLGNLCCPVPSCTKKFFFPNHFVQHLSIESKIDSIFNKIDIIECPFCTSVSHWLIFGRHLNDYHRDIMTILNKLKNGNDIICPNYKCDRGKVYSSNDGFEYLRHAINCRPLYMCKLCGTETKHQSYLKKHFVSCQGVGGKKRLKTETSEEENDASSDLSEAFKLKENSEVKVKKKVLLDEFGKRIRNSTGMMRKKMALRKRSPLHKKGTVIKNEESNSSLKTKGAKNRKISLKRKSSLINFHKDSLVSSDTTDLDISNDNHDISFTGEEVPGTSTSLFASPDEGHHHKTFLHNAIKKKVLKSISTNNERSQEESTGESSNWSKPHRTLENDDWFMEWKEKISKGIFRCGNEDCPESFILPGKLIEHMQNCLNNSSNKANLRSKSINCLWCGEHVQIMEFKEHAILSHSMLLETLQGESFVCQNYDCNTICDSAEDLLQHSAECPTCIVCVDCKLTFTSEDDYKNHDCMANDDLFRKRSIDMWRNQIRSGQLQCANLSCSSKFYLFDEFINHLQVCAKKSKFCRFAIEEGKMPCSHCPVMLSCDELVQHFADEHFEIINEVNKLKSGGTVKCISYKCKKIFDDPFKFFHHSTVCKPLYLCSTCTESFNGYRRYMSHPCMDTEEEESEVVGEEWYLCLKEAIYICPNKKCEKLFETFVDLLPHLQSCKKGNRSKYVLQNDVFGCCICKEDVGLSSFIDHFTQKHDRIMNQLLKMELTHSLKCENRSCKKVFVDCGKLLKHYMECKKPPREQHFKEKAAFSLSKWHEEIKKGNLYCPNCNNGFVELSLFIQHLRCCKIGTLASKAIQTPLPCFICKLDFPALNINDHFKNTHTLAFAQLKLVEQGICIHCPNNGCKKPFVKGIEYLQHVATVCEYNLPCELCGEYFSSKQLLDSHDCPQKEKSETDEDIWSEANQNVWYDKVMKGDLKCPNFRCGLDFILPRNFIDHIRVCTEGDACAAVINRKELPCCFCKRYVLLGRYCSHLASCHNKSVKARSTPLLKQEKLVSTSSSTKKKRKSELLPPKVSLPSAELITVADDNELSPVDSKLKSELIPTERKPSGLLKEKIIHQTSNLDKGKTVKGSKKLGRPRKILDKCDNSADNPITIDTSDQISSDHSALLDVSDLSLSKAPLTQVQSDVYEVDDLEPSANTSNILSEEKDDFFGKQNRYEKCLGPKTRSKGIVEIKSDENDFSTQSLISDQTMPTKDCSDIQVLTTRKSKSFKSSKLRDTKLYKRSISQSDSEEKNVSFDPNQGKSEVLVEDSVDSEHIPKPHSPTRLKKFKRKKMNDRSADLSMDSGISSTVKNPSKYECRRTRSKVLSKYAETMTDGRETEDSNTIPFLRDIKSKGRKRKNFVRSAIVDTTLPSVVDSVPEPANDLENLSQPLILDVISQTDEEKVENLTTKTVETAADSDDVSFSKTKENIIKICKERKKHGSRKSKPIDFPADSQDSGETDNSICDIPVEHTQTDSSDMLANFSGPVIKECEKALSGTEEQPISGSIVESNVEAIVQVEGASNEPTEDVNNKIVEEELPKESSLNFSSSKKAVIGQEKNLETTSRSFMTPNRTANTLIEASGVETPKLDNLLNSEKQIKHLVKSLLKKKKKKSKHLRRSEPMAWTVTEIVKTERPLVVESVDRTETMDLDMPSEKFSSANVVNQCETTSKDVHISPDINSFQSELRGNTFVEDIKFKPIAQSNNFASTSVEPIEEVATTAPSLMTKPDEPITNKDLLSKIKAIKEREVDLSNSMEESESLSPSSSKILPLENIKTVQTEVDSVLKQTVKMGQNLNEEKVKKTLSAEKGTTINLPEIENEEEEKTEQENEKIDNNYSLVENENELSDEYPLSDSMVKNTNEAESQESNNLAIHGTSLTVSTTKKNLLRDGLLDDSQSSLTEDEYKEDKGTSSIKELETRLISSHESKTGRKLKKKERKMPNLPSRKKYSLRGGDDGAPHGVNKIIESDSNNKDTDEIKTKREFSEPSTTEEEKGDQENIQAESNEEICRTKENSMSESCKDAYVDKKNTTDENDPVLDLTDSSVKPDFVNEKVKDVEFLSGDSVSNIESIDDKDDEKMLEERMLLKEITDEIKEKSEEIIDEDEMNEKEENVPFDLSEKLGVFDSILFDGEEQFLPKDIKKAFLSQILDDSGLHEHEGDKSSNDVVELDGATNAYSDNVVNEKDEDTAQIVKIKDNDLADLDGSHNSEEYPLKKITEADNTKTNAIIEEDDKMFSDSADSQEEDDSTPQIKNLKDGIHKVVDWLDNESKIAQVSEASQIESLSLPIATSKYNLVDMGGKLTMNKEIVSYHSPSSPVTQTPKMSPGKIDIIAVQSSETDSNVKAVSDEQTIIQDLAKKGDAAIKQKQETQTVPEKIETKPAVNVSRRFKYGKLSTFNRKKVAPKVTPKIPSKLSVSKGNASLSSEAESSNDDRYSAILEKTDRKTRTDPSSSTETDDTSSTVVNPRTDCHNEVNKTLSGSIETSTETNVSKDQSLYEEVMSPTKDSKDVEPVPALVSVRSNIDTTSSPIISTSSSVVSLSDPISVESSTRLFDLSSDISKSSKIQKNDTIPNAHAVNLLFQLSNPSVNSLASIPDDKNKDAFIDFKIEPSDFVPKFNESLTESISEEPVITYDSQEEIADKSLSEQKMPETPNSRSRIPSISITNDTEEGCVSPIYKPTTTTSLPPTGSPLKEMFFLIPKDTFDVQESHGESDTGSPPKLPELTSMMNHPHPQYLPNKLNDPKYSNLSQFEEAQVIENELQDLLSTSRPIEPTKLLGQDKDLREIVFDYNMICYFDKCNKTFFDPVSQIEHAKECSKNDNGKMEEWKILSKSSISCPECKLSVQVDQFGVHFQEKHPVLFGMLKDLTLRKQVKCKNHRCKSVPKTVTDVVHHFRKCGAAAQGKTQISCNQCGCIFKSRRESVNHKCNNDLDESDSDDLNESVANIIRTSQRLSSNTDNTKPVIASNENSSATDINQKEVSDLLKIIARPTIEIPSFELQSDTLKHNEGAENLLKLQGICENILTQSNIPLMKTDSIPDETSEILASLEDLNKTVNKNNNSGLALLSTKLSRTKKKKDISDLSPFDFVDEDTTAGKTSQKEIRNRKKRSLRKSKEGTDSHATNTTKSSKMKKMDIEEQKGADLTNENAAIEDKLISNKKKEKMIISQGENVVDTNENILEPIEDEDELSLLSISSKKKKRGVIEDDSTDDNAEMAKHSKSQRKPMKTYNLKSSVKDTPKSTVIIEDVKRKASRKTCSKESKQEETRDKKMEESNNEENWESLSVWTESVKEYNFYCPSDFCFKPFYRPNTMVSHIRCCVRTAGLYYNKKINCPECDQLVTVREFGKHLKSKHILIYWYLTELENGHWVICQNHTCAKYMEDIAECVEHYRRCDYLWKCKYCAIEYKEEKHVERHHCRTSSEDEDEDQSEGGGNDGNHKKKDGYNDKKKDDSGEDKENKDNKDGVGGSNSDNVNRKKEKNNDQDTNSLNNVNEKKTRKKSLKKELPLYNENVCEVDVENNNDGNVTIRDFTIECNIPIIKDKCKTDPFTNKVQVKNKKPKISAKSNIKVSNTKGDEKSDSASEKKGIQIEKVVKSIKKSICRKDGGLSEQVFQEWQKKFIRFNFFCPLEKCGFKTCSPALLCTHLKSCKVCMEELDMAVFSTQVESSNYNCPFDFCKRKNDNLAFFDFVRHVISTHKMLMNYLKAIHNNGFAVCLNFKCAEKLLTVDAAVQHFAVCKFLWQCKDCYIEYRCDISVKSHSCDLMANKANLSEEEEKELENGKKRKRKSAARAIGIISNLANSINQGKNGSPDDEEVGDGDDSSADTDYNAPSEESLSTTDSDSGDDESEDCPVDADDEHGNDKLSWKKKIEIHYYANFFRSWLKENACRGTYFSLMLPKMADIKYLVESEYNEYAPAPSTFPHIDLQYYAGYSKRKTIKMEIDQSNVVPALTGSSTMTFYVGGPIYAMEWCPLPKTSSQYIAFSTHRLFGETHCVSDIKTTAGCIQIWSIGNLTKSDETPTLALGLCHQVGPVYDMKWHPYGFDKKSSDDETGSTGRLGLLAVACGDGKVRLYGIPHPEELTSRESVYISMDPHGLLIPHKSNSFERHRTGMCLCLAWSPRADSTKLAAGYADGGVRIWDVDTKSILLHIEDLEMRAILPIITIDAHSYSVKSIAWCPSRNNVFVSVSSDKTLKVFDIAQPYNPLYIIKRGCFTCVEWPIARFSILFSEEDCFNIWPGSARSFVLQKYLEEKKQVNVDKQGPHATTRHNATVLSISYNNYLDLVATCDLAGEVIVSKDQDVVGSKHSTFVRKAEPVYRIERCELSNEEEQIPETTKTVEQADVECINAVEEYAKQASENNKAVFKYKYTFIDSNTFEYTQHRKRDDPDIARFRKTENLQSTSVTKYETRSVHKVAWNPNRGCHTWLASGTRLGIVRIHNFHAWRNSSKI